MSLMTDPDFQMMLYHNFSVTYFNRFTDNERVAIRIVNAHKTCVSNLCGTNYSRANWRSKDRSSLEHSSALQDRLAFCKSHIIYRSRNLISSMANRRNISCEVTSLTLVFLHLNRKYHRTAKSISLLFPRSPSNTNEWSYHIFHISAWNTNIFFCNQYHFEGRAECIRLEIWV